MSLVTWNGKLLLSPGGKLTLGPAQDECCCVEDELLCDCDCPIMETQVLTASISGTGVSCTFEFDLYDQQDLTYCRWRYSAVSPSPCFDVVTQTQINYVLLYCWHPLSARNPGKWEMFVEGNGNTGSLGGTLLLTDDPCPPPGTYNVAMYDPQGDVVATFVITIPDP